QVGAGRCCESGKKAGKDATPPRSDVGRGPERAEGKRDTGIPGVGPQICAAQKDGGCKSAAAADENAPTPRNAEYGEYYQESISQPDGALDEDTRTERCVGHCENKRIRRRRDRFKVAIGQIS